MSNKVVELPISIDNIECVTECWTHNRMIILKTSPYYEDWLASHYNLFATNERGFLFGETQVYVPDYYNDILTRKQIHLFGLTKKNVVDTLKDELLNGYYVNMMIKPFREATWVHEVVFYGYDDNKKLFHAIGLENRIFKKVDYSYTYIADIIQEIKEYFQQEWNEGVSLSYQYQYPVCAFRLNQDYCTDHCAFGAYNKIRNEFNGARFQIQEINALGTYEPSSQMYIGNNCLDALVNLLNQVMEAETPDYNLSKSLKKLYEHRKLMLISMRYLQKKWKKAMNSCTADCISTYEECSEVVGKWVNMSLKYELTGEQELLRKIIAEVPEVFKKEYQCLKEFLSRCVDWDTFNENYI